MSELLFLERISIFWNLALISRKMFRLAHVILPILTITMISEILFELYPEKS